MRHSSSSELHYPRRAVALVPACRVVLAPERLLTGVGHRVRIGDWEKAGAFYSERLSESPGYSGPPAGLSP